MRDIKFRAWDKHNKTMSQVDAILLSTDEILTSDNMGEPKAMYHYEMMQYTGLKDKHGKEIYEGDIVCMHYGSIYVVEWVEKLGLFTICRPIVSVASYPFIDYGRCEIIGNVHENPELIKTETT